MKWKIPKHSDLIMTDPWGLGKTIPAEVELFEKVGKEKAELEKARKEQSELFEKAKKEANKYGLNFKRVNSHLDPDVEAHIARERVKWLEAENKRLEQTNNRLVERNQDLTRTLKIIMEIKSDK